MKVLLRHAASDKKETIELAAMPKAGDEIHWPDHILKVVLEPKWFPLDDTNPHGHAGCLYVQGI